MAQEPQQLANIHIRTINALALCSGEELDAAQTTLLERLAAIGEVLAETRSSEARSGVDRASRKSLPENYNKETPPKTNSNAAQAIKIEDGDVFTTATHATVSWSQHSACALAPRCLVQNHSAPTRCS
eukprot:PhM_4_TR6312/c0_g1_i1/m.83527